MKYHLKKQKKETIKVKRRLKGNKTEKKAKSCWGKADGEERDEKSENKIKETLLVDIQIQEMDFRC